MRWIVEMLIAMSTMMMIMRMMVIMVMMKMIKMMTTNGTGVLEAVFSCDTINQSVLLGRLSMDNSPLGIRFEYSFAVEQKRNSEQSKLVSVPIASTCPTQFAGVELASDHSFNMMC